MSNDLATLTDKLETQLGDTDNAVWASTELNDLITWATEELFLYRPRVARESVTLADDDDQYTLSTLHTVYRVDLIDGDDQLLMPLPAGSWETWGDGQESGMTLYINPTYARTGWSLRVHGYAPYDLTSNYPPNRVVPLILATARAEAYRRLIGERARYEQWAQGNPRSNTSMNELIQNVNNAEQEADRLRSTLRVFSRPVPAKVG